MTPGGGVADVDARAIGLAGGSLLARGLARVLAVPACAWPSSRLHGRVAGLAPWQGARAMGGGLLAASAMRLLVMAAAGAPPPGEAVVWGLAGAAGVALFGWPAAAVAAWRGRSVLGGPPRPGEPS
ncbi:MAG: hypothetical protein AB7H88_04185 [Vicinamibacterales bacterium]